MQENKLQIDVHATIAANAAPRGAVCTIVHTDTSVMHLPWDTFYCIQELGDTCLLVTEQQTTEEGGIQYKGLTMPESKDLTTALVDAYHGFFQKVAR